MSTYKNLAEAIVSFSSHNLNKVEFFEIVSNIIAESTDADKEELFAPKLVGLTKYQAAKNWLIKK